MSEAKPPPPEEDELDELPPIDGDGGDEADDELMPEELDDDPEDGAADPLDDSTGEGDPLEEIEVNGSESGWLDDAGDSDGLDVGTPDTFGEEEESSTLLEGAEELDVGEEEFAFGAEDGSLVGDAGEEGFEDEDEDLREEDLPRLDSGQDDAESEDVDVGEPLIDDDVMEETRPPWDDRAWERAEGGPAGLAAVDSLASVADGVILGGQGLARIDRAGRLTVLEALGLRGGAPRALLVDGAWLLVATPRAGILVSRDGGRSFAEANGWRSLVVGQEREGALDLALVGGDLWGRTPSGIVLFSGDRGETWSRVLPERRFDAIGGDLEAGDVVAVARDPGGTTIARGAAGTLALSTAGPLPVGSMSLAAQGGRLAVGVALRGAFQFDGGAWSRLEGTAALTALTFARDGTLAMALHSEGEGRAWIVEARAGGPARTVAELGDTPGISSHEDGDDARVRALSWDAGAGILWAAGGFGLTAFRPPRVIRPRTG
jgi:hypothetical protein